MADLKGTVKWFNNNKGYGFLLQEDGTDLFVHFSAIKAEGFKTLSEGDTVTYQVLESDGKTQAVEVEVVVPVTEEQKA